MPTTYIPLRWYDLKDHVYRIATTINMLLQGAHNDVYDFTATAGVGITVFPSTGTLERITPATVPVLVPMTYNAQVAPGPIPFAIWPQTIGVGSITFWHSNTANADQDFKLLLFGD